MEDKSIKIDNGTFLKGMAKDISLKDFKKMFPNFSGDYKNAFKLLGGKEGKSSDESKAN